MAGGGDGAAAKPALGVIFLGHVDSGKSTLIGHLMLKLGAVDAKCVRPPAQQCTLSVSRFECHACD